MKLSALVTGPCLAAGLLFPGCALVLKEKQAGIGMPSMRAAQEVAGGDLWAPQPFTVNGQKLTDYGITAVRTNPGVRHNGAKLIWIVISEVAPRSAADRANLRAGDEILALNGIILAEASGDIMLDLLWQKKPGAQVRLLVRRQTQGQPEIIDLVAGRDIQAN